MPTLIRGQQTIIGGTITATSKIGSTGQTVYTFKGTEQEIINKANELYAAGWETQIQTGPIWTLNASYAADIVRDPNTPQQEPYPDWEVQVTPYQRNLLESDIAAVKQLSSKTKNLIEYKLKNPTSDLPIVEWENLNNETYIENAENVYKLMATGVDSILSFSTEVKRTITVQRGFNLGWSLVNNGKVLRKATMVSNYGIPADIAALLPTQADGTEDYGGVVYGYLEQGPSYRLVSKNQVQISQAWTYNKWSEMMYDIV